MADHFDKQRISSIILEHLKSNVNTPYEIEVRYSLGFVPGFNNQDTQNQEIAYKEFELLREYLTKVLKTPKISHSKDLRDDKNQRQTIKINQDGSYENVNIQKERAEIFYDNEYNFKVALSKEIPLEDVPDVKEPTLIRNKHRYSWRIPVNNCPDYFIVFDLTKVDQENVGIKTETRYEVELELESPFLLKRTSPVTGQQMSTFTLAMKQLSAFTLTVKAKLQGSDYQYSFKNKNDIAHFFNISMKDTNIKEFKKGEVNYNIMVKARNLKLKEMVSGGLLSKVNGTNYSVTIKADGVRKFLVIHETGLWLIYPTTEFCRVLHTGNLPAPWKEYTNTILDGEDIPPHSRKIYTEADHFYIPFDTLVFKGRNVTKEPHEKRMKYTEYIMNLGSIPVRNKLHFVMENKKFFYFKDTYESYQLAMNNVFQAFENAKKRYNLDGLIFTPNNTVYNPHSDRLEDYQRVLMKNPDICKWKPLEELTMDLAFVITSKSRKLFGLTERGRKLEEFTGSDQYSFDPESQVDWFHPLLSKDLPGNQIIEFGLKFVDNVPYVNAKRNYVLIPKRVRSDKEYPNKLGIVKGIWNDIHDPITKDTLLGKDIILLRKYHNRCKRELLSKTTKGSYLIDIGSGRGGDMDKMSNFDKILAIEPSKENLYGTKDSTGSSFQQRLNSKSEEFRNRFNLLNCGGEETEKILEAVDETFNGFSDEKPLYISMMLSMSFFFDKDGEYLEGLQRTITGIVNLYKMKTFGKYPVKFLFMTIEKERTLKVMYEYNNHLKCNNFEMIYEPSSETVMLNLPGTIVGIQKEYLVDLKKFKDMVGATTDYIKEANEEKFLSSCEKDITSMYVYGSYTLQ